MLTEKIRKEYQISNFVYHSLPTGELVIQNLYGITKIHNQKLIEIIKRWDQNYHNIINDNYFYDEFKEQSQALIDFLLNNKIIQIVSKPNLNIKNIVFISNNIDVKELMQEFFSRDQKNKFEVSFYDTNENLSLDKENTFYCVFLNPYNKFVAKKIRDKFMSNKNTLSIMSYVYNNHFYIDSVYSAKWKNPCHVCHMGYIESQLRVDSSNNITYQKMIDSLYNEYKDINIETPLSFNQILNITTNLTNRINKLITLESGNIVYTDEFLESFIMDLRTGEFHKDIPIHWEMCDCYE